MAIENASDTWPQTIKGRTLGALEEEESSSIEEGKPVLVGD